MSIESVEEWEYQEVERLRDRVDEEHEKLRNLIEILAMLGIQAEHSPDGWMVTDEHLWQLSA